MPFCSDNPRRFLLLEHPLDRIHLWSDRRDLLFVLFVSHQTLPRWSKRPLIRHSPDKNDTWLEINQIIIQTAFAGMPGQTLFFPFGLPSVRPSWVWSEFFSVWQSISVLEGGVLFKWRQHWFISLSRMSELAMRKHRRESHLVFYYHPRSISNAFQNTP